MIVYLVYKWINKDKGIIGQSIILLYVLWITVYTIKLVGKQHAL